MAPSGRIHNPRTLSVAVKRSSLLCGRATEPRFSRRTCLGKTLRALSPSLLFSLRQGAAKSASSSNLYKLEPQAVYTKQARRCSMLPYRASTTSSTCLPASSPLVGERWTRLNIWQESSLERRNPRGTTDTDAAPDCMRKRGADRYHTRVMAPKIHLPPFSAHPPAILPAWNCN